MTLTAGQLRWAGGLVDPRADPLCAAIAARKCAAGDLCLEVVRAWRDWPWIPAAAELEAIVIYTDGSALDGERGVTTGGWGLIILAVARVSGTRVFGLVGAAGAALDAGPGSLRATAPLAELTGIHAALSLLHVCPLLAGTAVVILSDCQYAIAAATAKCSTSAHASAASPAQQLFVSWPGLCLFGWVPGHQSDPGNELADVVANAAREAQCVQAGIPLLSSIPDSTFFMAHHPLVQRAWCRDPRGYADAAVAASLAEQQSLTFWQQVCAAPDPAEALSASAPETRRIVTFATANALTLHPAQEEGGFFSCRRQQLEATFDGHLVDVIGVQEARGRSSAQRQGEHFCSVATAATPGGDYGLELWVRKAFCPGGCAAFHVLIAEPRRLLAQVGTAMGQLAFLVLHAPSVVEPSARSAGCSEQEVAAWWLDTASKVAAQQLAVPLVCLADANARVGSVCSSAIGPVDVHVENASGTSFHEFLLDLGLFAPSTFHGGGPTWASNAGALLRLDFVALPLLWSAAVVRTVVLPFAELALEDRSDHAAAYAQVMLTCPASDDAPPSRPWYNRNALRLDDVRLSIERAWQEVPPLPAAWDAEQAHAAITRHARQLMERLCPVVRAAPRKQWMTMPTWKKVREHATIRRSFFAAAGQRKKAFLAGFFASWARLAGHDCAAICQTSLDLVDLLWVRWSIAGGAWRIALASASAAARQAAKQDLNQWVKGQAAQVAKDAGDGNWRSLWQLVGRLSGRKAAKFPRPVAVIMRPDGIAAATDEEAAECWCALFSADFGHGAREVTVDVLSEEVRAFHDARQVRLEGEPSPTEWTIIAATAAARAKSGKATGPDEVPAEFWKAGGLAAARRMGELYGIAGRNGVCLSWRGGLMTPIPRRPGAGLSGTNARGILCADALGKFYGGHLRWRLRPALVAETAGTQSGAVPGGGTAAPAMFARTFIEAAKARGLAAGLVFTDIRAAFYSCWPELAVGAVLPAHRREDIFKRAGLCQDRIDSLQAAIVQEATAFAKHDVPPFWRDAARDWQAGAHFTVRHSDKRVATDTGTKPGDAPADLIFAVVFAQVQADLHEALRCEDLLCHEPFSAVGPFGLCSPSSYEGELDYCCDVDLPGPAYMDDLTVPVRHADPLVLLGMLARVAELAAIVFARFGMLVNFMAGKTEAVVAIRGVGSCAARRRLAELIDPASKIPMLPLASGTALRVVDHYKHLGAKLAGSGTMQAEVTHRCSGGRTATAALGRRIWSNEGLEISTRAALATACVNTRVLYLAGNWGPLSAQQARQVEVELLRPLRRIVGAEQTAIKAARAEQEGLPAVACWTTPAVCAATATPLPRALIDIERLRIAGQYAHRAPVPLRALLQGPGAAAWRQQLCLSLAILRRFRVPALDMLPEPTDDFALATWTEYMREAPGKWRGHLQQLRAAVVADPALYEHLDKQLRGASADECAESAEWACYECGHIARSHRCLRLHAVRVHGLRREVRKFCVTAICPTCGTDWHSRLRCLHHMQRAACCKVPWESGLVAECDPQLVLEADAADRQLRRDLRKQGRCELAGPPPIRPQPVAAAVPLEAAAPDAA